MKKLINVFSVVLVLSTILSSCKKDEDNSPKNYFKVGDTQYELSAGAIAGWEQTSTKGVYFVDLVLHSKGLETKGADEIVGKGNAVYFDMESSMLTDLPDGNYVYGLSNSGLVNIFSQGIFFINYDASAENAETTISAKAGTVTIKKSGSDYEITISCTATDGKSVTGYYKGSLTHY